MPTTTLMSALRAIIDTFKEASFLAKISIMVGVGLVYAVVTLYKDMSGLGDRLNQRISDCHESRVRELIGIYQKTSELELKVRYNNDKVQESINEIQKLKADKVSYNN